MMLKFPFASLCVLSLSLSVFCHRIVRRQGGAVLKGGSPAGLENTTNLDFQASSNPIPADAAYFNFMDVEDATLSTGVSACSFASKAGGMVGQKGSSLSFCTDDPSRGYKATLSGWSHTRDYAGGFLREATSSGIQEPTVGVSQLNSSVEYQFAVFQSEYPGTGDLRTLITTPNSLEVNSEPVVTKQWDNWYPTAQGSVMSTASGNIVFTFKMVPANKEIHISGLKIWVAPTCQSLGVRDTMYMTNAMKQTRGEGARLSESWKFKTDEEGQFECLGLAIFGAEDKWQTPLESNDELRCQADPTGSAGFLGSPYNSKGFYSPLCCWCRELHCEAPSFVLTYDVKSNPRFQCRKMGIWGDWAELLDVSDDMDYEVPLGYNASVPTQTVVDFQGSTREVIKQGFYYRNKNYSDYESLMSFNNSLVSSHLSRTYTVTQPFAKKDGAHVYQWVWTVRTDGLSSIQVRCLTVQANKRPECLPGFAKEDKKGDPNKWYQKCHLP